MTEATRGIFYDGPLRPIEEALRRISADVPTFLDDAVHRYERSGSPWSLLRFSSPIADCHSPYPMKPRRGLLMVDSVSVY